MNLTERLASLAPKESDQLLASIWHDFKDTDAHQALSIVLDNLAATALKEVTAPAATADSRAFQAGVIAATRHIGLFIAQAFAFDPSKIDYDTPTPQSAAVEDDLSADLPAYTMLSKESN